MRGNTLRALAPGVLVLALVGFVAIASTGSRPAGTDETRKPADALLDIFFSFALVALIPAAAILVWGLMQRKAIARQVATGRVPRTGLLTFFTFLLVAAVLWWRFRDTRTPAPEELVDNLFPGQEVPYRPEEKGEVTTSYEPEFAWIPVLVVVTLAVVALVAAAVAARRRQNVAAEEDGVAHAVADILEDTLDDLRAETDPRRAVIAAYARLERTLAAHGSARRAAETPEEYLARILRHLEVDRHSVRALTDLFTRAKFSQHDVDAGMKEKAIDALVRVRDELRAAREALPEEHFPSSLRVRGEGA
jgi:hypothetical protein